MKPVPQLPASIQTRVQAHWLAGFSPEMRETFQTPNGMAMTLLLLGGRVRYLLADVKQLQPALATYHSVDKMTVTDFIDAFEGLNVDNIKKLKDSACTIFTVTQSADEILYVPAGWLLSAATVQGALAYGCRKCWAFATESQHASYESLHGLFAHSGMKAGKMQEVLQAIDADTEWSGITANGPTRILRQLGAAPSADVGRSETRRGAWQGGVLP